MSDIRCLCGHTIENHDITALDRVKCEAKNCTCVKFTRVYDPESFRLTIQDQFLLAKYRVFLEKQARKEEPPLV